jgi:dTMP kinase
MLFEIEGIEGAGKTTQALLLQEWMKKRGLDSVVVKELESTNFGKEIRGLLLKNGLKDSKAEMFLFLSCKAQVFSQAIMPYLAQGKHVISDRGSGSFISYNSSMLGLDKSILIDFLHIAMSNTEPAMTILLDIPIETALKRIEGKTEKTRFDTIGEIYLKKQRNKFIELSKYFPWWVCINGSLSIEEVCLKITKNIEKLLKI